MNQSPSSNTLINTKDTHLLVVSLFSKGFRIEIDIAIEDSLALH